MKHLLFGAATVMLGSSLVNAQETRQMDAHEHGAVEMNLAVDGSIVFIEIHSPSINIVGFEHPPESSEDKEAVAKGATAATLRVVEREDLPLAYLPGRAIRVRVRVAGDLQIG